MKMRKRIAALLAVAMVAALMPMTAFAKSTNRLTHDVIKVEKGGSNVGQGQELKIELTDGVKKDDVFRVELVGAEWDVTTPAATDFTFDKKIEGSRLEVKVTDTPGTMDGEEVITIPVNAKNIVGDDDGKAYVVVDGWDTAISSSKEQFATVSTAKASVTVADAPTFYDGKNKIAKIKVEENSVGAFAAAGTKNTFVVDLYNTDYEFVNLNNLTFDYSMGFRNADADAITVDYANVGSKKDFQRVIFTVDTDEIPSGQRGIVEFELEVEATGRRPETGELEATISGDLVEEKTVVVANIAEYGVELKTSDDKVYEYYAGRQETVKLTLNETVDKSMSYGRLTDFRLPEGVYFNEVKRIDKKGDKHNVDNYLFEDKLHPNRITGFTYTVDTNESLNDNLGAFTFEAKLDIPSAFKGDITLSTEGRAFEDLETTIAEVEPAIKVTVEPMTVKVGLKEQVGGKIIIEEQVAGALRRGQDITIDVEGVFKDSMAVKGASKVEITSEGSKGVILANPEARKDGVLDIGIKRESREPSTIEITGVSVVLDRTVPEGSYNLAVGGKAISDLVGKKIDVKDKDDKGVEPYGKDPIEVKDFIFVGEKYTRPVTVFTIGSNTFTVNGEPRVMDASSYLKEGRTMVPVRYLAYALGIPEEAIKYNAGVVTIIDDSKVIQVTRGSNELVVNGMVIPMETSAENSKEDGRAYVPFKDIGAVFGVTGHWDPVAQTATFK